MTGQTSTSTTQSGPPPQVMQNYQALTGAAAGQATQPLQQYAGPMVAGFTPQQQAGFQTVDNTQGVWAPYVNAAAQEFGQATTPLWPTLPHFDTSSLPNLGMSSLGNASGAAGSALDTARNLSLPGYDTLPTYFNPYQKQVTDTTRALFNEQNAQRQAQIQGDAASRNAYGGDREAVAQALATQQENLAQAPVLANIQQQGFQQAQQELNTQQQLALQKQLGQGQLELGAGGLYSGIGQGAFGEFNNQQQQQLAAEQANAWLASQAAFGMGSLGSQAQSLGLQGAQAEIGAGGLQQQLAQEQLNIPYQQFLQTQAYPYQQLGFLAPIVEGTGSLSGGQGSTTTPGPSTIGQIAGLGIAGAGLYKSGLFGGGSSSGGGGAPGGVGNNYGASTGNPGIYSGPFAKTGGRIGDEPRRHFAAGGYTSLGGAGAPGQYGGAGTGLPTPVPMTSLGSSPQPAPVPQTLFTPSPPPVGPTQAEQFAAARAQLPSMVPPSAPSPMPTFGGSAQGNGPQIAPYTPRPFSFGAQAGQPQIASYSPPPPAGLSIVNGAPQFNRPQAIAEPQIAPFGGQPSPGLTPHFAAGGMMREPSVPGIGQDVPTIDLSYIPQGAPGGMANKELSPFQPNVNSTQSSGGGFDPLSLIGAAVKVGGLFMADGGSVPRGTFDDGGTVSPYGALPKVPAINLDYIVAPGPAVKGSGPPRPPSAPPQDDPLKDMTTLAGSAKSMKGLFGSGNNSSSSSSSDTSGSADGGRISYQTGGSNITAGAAGNVPLGAAISYGGAPPNIQQSYQQLLEMPLDRLQQMAVQFPPSTQQGQLVARALAAKKMTVGAGTADASATQTPISGGAGSIGQTPSMGGLGTSAIGAAPQDFGGTAHLATGGASDDTPGYVTEDELDPHPIVDHSGDTVKIRYPSEGKVLDLGLPPIRDHEHRAAGGASGDAPVHVPQIDTAFTTAPGIDAGFFKSPNGVALPQLATSASPHGSMFQGNDTAGNNNFQPGGGLGNWFAPLEQYMPPGAGPTGPGGSMVFPSRTAFTPQMGGIISALNPGLTTLPPWAGGPDPGDATSGSTDTTDTTSSTDQATQDALAAAIASQVQGSNTGGKRGGRFDDGGDVGNDPGMEDYTPSDLGTSRKVVAHTDIPPLPVDKGAYADIPPPPKERVVAHADIAPPPVDKGAHADIPPSVDRGAHADIPPALPEPREDTLTAPSSLGRPTPASDTADILAEHEKIDRPGFYSRGPWASSYGIAPEPRPFPVRQNDVSGVTEMANPKTVLPPTGLGSAHAAIPLALTGSERPLEPSRNGLAPIPMPTGTSIGAFTPPRTGGIGDTALSVSPEDYAPSAAPAPTIPAAKPVEAAAPTRPAAQPATTERTQRRFAFYGDSVANGTRQAMGAPGVTHDGWTPDKVLGAFTGADLKGQTAVISSGITNSRDQWQEHMALVPQQIAAARAAGASDVVLYGVGEGVKNNRNINERLSEVAAANNAKFVPLIGTDAYTDTQGVQHPAVWHPHDYAAQGQYTQSQIGNETERPASAGPDVGSAPGAASTEVGRPTLTPAGATTQPPGKTYPGQENAQTIIDTARNEVKASPAATQAVLNQVFYEGGFADPWHQSTIISPNGSQERSWGHWQLNANGELPGYEAFLKQTGLPRDTHSQTLYVFKRAEEIHPGFSQIQDPKQATDILNTGFEGYQGAGPGQRYGNLENASRAMNGDFSALGSAPTGGRGGGGDGAVQMVGPGTGRPGIGEPGAATPAADPATTRAVASEVLDRTPPEHRNAMREWMNSPWFPVFLAGAGMLASRSPFPGVALGEGLLMAGKGVETAAGLQNKSELADARTAAASNLADVRSAAQIEKMRNDAATLQFKYDNLDRLTKSGQATLDEKAAKDAVAAQLHVAQVNLATAEHDRKVQADKDRDERAREQAAATARYHDAMAGRPPSSLALFDRRQAAWLAVHPNDQEGAMRFANNQHGMTPEQTNLAAQKLAQADLAADLSAMSLTPAQRQAREHTLTQFHLKELGGAPAAAPAAPAAPAAATAQPAAPAATPAMPAWAKGAPYKAPDGKPIFTDGSGWYYADHSAYVPPAQ